MRTIVAADPRSPQRTPTGQPLPTPRKRQWRDLIATGGMLLVGAALILPFTGAQAAPSSTVLITPAAIRALPMSGTAWNNLKKYADGSDGKADIEDQNSNNDVRTLAQALVFVRTGTESYRTRAINNLKAAVGTEAGGRTLALARNLPGYVIAADLVNIAQVDPGWNVNKFRPWLRSLLGKTMSDGKSLRQIHEQRPNNWGSHAGAARAAIAVYLGDEAELARTAQVFRGWLGDRSAYSGFKYGDLDWQSDPAKAVAILPASAAKSYDGSTVSLDGALPDELRRGGDFHWTPSYTGYPWEALQGAVLQAEILNHAGYDAWAWSNKALARAATWLYKKANWPATGDDRWQPWLIDARTGANLPRPSSTSVGKNFGFADWLYGGS